MADTIAKAALVMTVINVASRILGFARETAIAGVYGATAWTDAYQVAYTLPYFLQTVLGMALVSSIVPLVTRRLARNEREAAWDAANAAMSWVLLLMTGLSALGMACAGLLVRLTAPGFDAATAAAAVRMTVIMFPSIICMGFGQMTTGILNANKSFAVAAFAPGFSSLIIVGGVLAAGGRGIDALAWATLVSFAGAMAIQIPALYRTGYRFRFRLDRRNPEVNRMFAGLLPIFIGTATNQIYLAINRFFASGLAEGSISALNYAGKLMTLPLNIFVLAISSAIFPSLSEMALDKDKGELGRTLRRGLVLVLLITLPAAAGLMALRTPIVRLLFQRGAFDADATRMTASALLWFGPGMGAMAASQILTRAYYALGDVKIPLAAGLASIAVNILASVLFTGSMGQGGLALANSLASLFNALCMFVFLRRKLRLWTKVGILGSLGKALGAAAATGAAAYAVSAFLEAMLPGGGIALVLRVGASVAAGGAVYFLALFVLREEEWTGFIGRLFAGRQKNQYKKLTK
ncbi:MAG: murein biosynthesis integral membrane protein MurJ [Peptococcaceae bacterium]|jgi:putative peptidoglycan lipid II flippase|nr:murein biosynthesis integral membrane protein MurJ [Peptococcaceae bacterium]